MEFLERTLEDLIWERIEIKDFESLHKRGLPLSANRTYFRQPNLGDYGIPDIIGVQLFPGKKAHFTVIELKKDRVGPATLIQAIRYSHALKRIAWVRGVEDVTFNIVLIGKEVEQDLAYMGLVTGPPFVVRTLTYYYSFDNGLSFFEDHGDYSRQTISPKFTLTELRGLYNHQIKSESTDGKRSSDPLVLE
jgi:hypothetical protein